MLWLKLSDVVFACPDEAPSKTRLQPASGVVVVDMVALGVALKVGVCVAESVAVGVALKLGVNVKVGDWTKVAVTVAVPVTVGVAVRVAVKLGVAVQLAQGALKSSTTWAPMLAALDSVQPRL